MQNKEEFKFTEEQLLSIVEKMIDSVYQSDKQKLALRQIHGAMLKSLIKENENE